MSDATETTSFSDLGRDMWSYLTGQEATIDYTLVDMIVEVPRSTGPDSARAIWKLNGTLRITTNVVRLPRGFRRTTTGLSSRSLTRRPCCDVCRDVASVGTCPLLCRWTNLPTSRSGSPLAGTTWG